MRNKLPTTNNDSTIVSPMILASNWQRLGTFWLDGFFLDGFVSIMIKILLFIGLRDLILNMNPYLLGIILTLVYYISQEALWGRTIGKLITGTKVVNENGAKISLGQAVGRSLCRFIPFDILSFLGGETPIGWHDQIPKTRVISVRK